ncbi:hypothetical protein D3C81_1560520 [compost metagenome]
MNNLTIIDIIKFSITEGFYNFLIILNRLNFKKYRKHKKLYKELCDIIDEVSLYTYLIDKGPIKITKYNYLTNKEIMFYYNKFNFIRLNLIYNGKLEMVPGHT